MAEVAQPKLSAREKRWRAEDDARTLANAEVIKEDASRLGLAKKAATRIAKQERESADAMADVAKGNVAKSPDNKGPRKRSRRKSSPKGNRQSFNVFQKVGGK